MAALNDQDKLEEAKEALHKLNTGQMARVLVDQNGERIEFTVANRTELKKYISELEAKVAGGSGSRVVRPATVIF